MKASTEKTYTIGDIEKVAFSETPLAVIGHPINHSVSPAMHNAALLELSKKDTRFKAWAYYRFDIAPDEFSEALILFHRRGFLGLNLTIPHKVQVMDLIKGVSPDAKAMGAANTLVWNEFGYDGFNTDGYGLEQGLDTELKMPLKDSTVMLLGSGGAARAAAVQCVLSGCERLYVGNRSPDRLQGLLEILKALGGDTEVHAFPLNILPQDLPEIGVLINATSLGLQADDPAPVDVEKLPIGWKVYDMIYNPPMTTLLNKAKAHNLPVANGLSMLINQGARALEIWSHETVDTNVMMIAARKALNLSIEND